MLSFVHFKGAKDDPNDFKKTIVIAFSRMGLLLRFVYQNYFLSKLTKIVVGKEGQDRLTQHDKYSICIVITWHVGIYTYMARKNESKIIFVVASTQVACSSFVLCHCNTLSFESLIDQSYLCHLHTAITHFKKRSEVVRG